MQDVISGNAAAVDIGRTVFLRHEPGNRMKVILTAVILTAVLSSAVFSFEPIGSFSVVDSIPHDTTSETRGLDFFENRLYESTSTPGGPALMAIDPVTGDTLIIKWLEERLRPQGVTAVGDKLIQMTFKEILGFVYDRYSFFPVDTFFLPIVEGVGITFDGQRLILSDGTSKLVYVDTASYEETGQIQITDDGKAVHYISEIEYFDNLLLAAVIPSMKIAVIEPQSGEVLQWLDLSLICRPPERSFIFGLAWDESTRTLLVTGPRWPWIYRVRLTE